MEVENSVSEVTSIRVILGYDFKFVDSPIRNRLPVVLVFVAT